MTGLVTVLVYLLLQSHSLVQAQVAGLFGDTFQGDATYYSTTFGSGACSFAQGSVQYSPWLSGTKTIVAVNAPQFFGSQTCGLCLSYQGLGSGAGANPVPETPQYAIVGDLCPECKNGDLDQAMTGDGRFTISWTPLQCSVGSSNFVYSFQGSNAYYFKLQVANTRVPVLSVAIQYNGNYRQMNRVSDNYFVMYADYGSAFPLPASLAITSVLNDTVYDTLAVHSPSGNVPGNVQFPLSSQWSTVGLSASTESALPATSAAPLSPPAAGTLPPPAVRSSPPSMQHQPPASTVNAKTPPASPKALTLLPPKAPALPPSAPQKPSPAAPLTLPPKQNRPPPSHAPTTTVSNLTAQPLSKIPFIQQGNNSVQTSIGILPYMQCGGTGASCFGPQCQDAPFPGTSCSADGNGTSYACSRVNQFFYQCLPSQLAAAQSAGIVESLSNIYYPPSGRTESAAPCPLPVGDYQQCGGEGGFCSKVANGTAAACADADWQGACCASSGFTCLRYSASYWECRNTPFSS